MKRYSRLLLWAQIHVLANAERDSDVVGQVLGDDYAAGNHSGRANFAGRVLGAESGRLAQTDRLLRMRKVCGGT